MIGSHLELCPETWRAKEGMKIIIIIITHTHTPLISGLKKLRDCLDPEVSMGDKTKTRNLEMASTCSSSHHPAFMYPPNFSKMWFTSTGLFPHLSALLNPPTSGVQLHYSTKQLLIALSMKLLHSMNFFFNIHFI